MLHLQSAGIATIILHHANKPQDGKPTGVEAGSSHQLSNLDEQLSLIQCFADEEIAQVRRGLHTPHVFETLKMLREPNPEPVAAGAPPLNDDLAMVIRMFHQKPRNLSANHILEPIYFGLCRRNRPSDRELDGTLYVVSTPTEGPRQVAKRMARQGKNVREIAATIERSTREVAQQLLA